MGSISFTSSSKKSQFVRDLKGALTFDVERDLYRVRTFLPRNMSSVLAYHGKRKAISKNGDLLRGSNELPIEPQSQSCKTWINGNSDATAESLDEPSLWGSPAIKTMSSECLAVRGTKVAANDGQHQPRRSLRQLNDAQLHATDAILTIGLRSIRKKLNFKANRSQDGQPPSKRQKRDATKCQCSLTIWDNRDTLTEGEPIIRKTENCFITTTQTLASGYSVSVDIELENEFRVNVNELKVPLDRNKEAVLALSDKYFMELKIIPTKVDVEWPPIPVLGKSEGDQVAGLSKTVVEKLQGALVARYLKLPQAIAAETPLSVYFLHEGRTYRTKYGLEVDSHWGKPTYMTSIKQEAIDGSSLEHFLPKEEEDDDFEPENRKRSRSKKVKPSRPLVKVFYIVDGPGIEDVHKDFRKAMVQGFGCPACPSQSFPTLKELRFHFVNSHEKYNFMVEQREDETTKELLAVVVKIKPLERKTTKLLNRMGVLNGLHMDWIAPSEPFDIDAFLNDDKSWLGETKRKTQTVAASEDPRAKLRSQHDGFLPAKHVRPLPAPNRKKHAIIKLQTKTRDKETMYTSVGHRPLTLSEESRSESDDDMDNEWYLQKHLESLDLTAKSQNQDPVKHELQRRWDIHVTIEGLSNTRYTSDCLIRFMKAQSSWLKQAEVRTWFLNFLKVLQARRLVDVAIFLDCHLFLNDAEVAQEHTSNTTHTRIPQKPPRENEIPTVATATQEAHIGNLLALPQGSCGVCTKPVKSMKDAIRCSDADCETAIVRYHRKCLGKIPGANTDWTCAICERRHVVKGKRRAVSPEVPHATWLPEGPEVTQSLKVPTSFMARKRSSLS